MNNKINLCVECNYVRIPKAVPGEPKCYHPGSLTSQVDYVFGQKYYYSCKVAREEASMCGATGVWYDPIKALC